MVTVVLSGYGKSYSGGDDDYLVTGGTGATTVSLGSGNDTVKLGGSYDSVSLGGGTDSVETDGGNAVITVLASDLTPHDTILLSGQHNAVNLSAGGGHAFEDGFATITGGTGYGTFITVDFHLTLTTSGFYNNIVTSNADVSITAGSGYDTVTLGTVYFPGGALSKVTLAGTHNVVQGAADNALIAGGTGYGTFDIFDTGFPDDSTTVKITTSGLSNTFLLSDTSTNTIVAGSGYDHVTIETPPSYGFTPIGPLPLAPSAVTFAGLGNTLVASDAPITATGGSGNGNFTVGNGNDSITTSGSHNVISAGVGTDYIEDDGDSASISVGGDEGATPDDTIVISGGHNAVTAVGYSGHSPADGFVTITGGTGYGTFQTNDFHLKLTTGGLYNQIDAQNSDATIVAGSGYDTVTIGSVFNPGSSLTSVTIAGTHNLVQGFSDNAAITGGTGSNTFNVTNSGIGGNSPATSITTGGMFNAITVSDTSADTITAGSGYDHVVIATPSPYPFDGLPALPLAASTVTFAGLGNSLTATNAPVTVTGGTGLATFVLGNGDDSVTTDGANNSITLGTGTDTVDAGSGSDTVVLNGSNGLATMSGSGDKITFNSGAHGLVVDDATALRVYVAPGVGAIHLLNLAQDPGFVVDLIGGAGGYTTAAQAAAAVHPDFGGGSILAVGTGSIHFDGIPVVTASSFHIG